MSHPAVRDPVLAVFISLILMDTHAKLECHLFLRHAEFQPPGAQDLSGSVSHSRTAFHR